MKKGFTLIELLAVIVVLAVVATVAIPVVSNVIGSGKVGALENSAEFYIKEVETNFSEWTIEGFPTGLTDIKNESGYVILDAAQLNDVLDLKGSKPISGTVKIDNNYSVDNYYFGYVVYAELEYEDEYVATYTYHTDDNYTGNRAEIDISKK